MRFKLGDPDVVAILDSGEDSHKVSAGVQTILSSRLTNALSQHAKALTDAAAASDKYSRKIAQATSALVGATAVLALVAIVQIVVMIVRT